MERIYKYRQALFLLVLAFALASACTIETDGALEGGAIAQGDEAPAANGGEQNGADAVGVESGQVIKRGAIGRLQQAIQRYEQIQQNGGFPDVPTGNTLKPGESSERVDELRQFLTMTGDLQATADTAQGDVYTERLAEAVRRFQKRHGLTQDGALGPNTVEAMNVPVEQRLRHMEASLERLQQLPDTLSQRFLLVNIPEFALHMYEGGKAVQHMPVIVGEEYDDQQTPRFSDRMEHIIFRPYWNVPVSIASEELVPEGIEYLKQNGFEIVEAWTPEAEPVGLTQANLERVKSGELKLRQKPGPENALGLVKFMFPNEKAIYLHGTPADHLFGEETRAFSHGCIRVARPVDLALYALEGKPEWTRERIEQAMKSGERQQVQLAQQIPVHITYLTAYVDSQGQLQFRDDIYNIVEGGPLPESPAAEAEAEDEPAEGASASVE